MPYLRSYRGDYLGGYRGDPGLFGFIKKAIGTVTGVVGKLGIPGISGVAGGISGALAGRRAAAPVQRFPGGMPILRMGGQVPVPGLRGIAQRTFPGGETGYMEAPKRRRMNVANPKALRKAIRRQAGFVKLARKALKGTGYSIVSRGSRVRRPRVSIRESGSGGVTYQP